LAQRETMKSDTTALQLEYADQAGEARRPPQLVWANHRAAMVQHGLGC